MVHFFSDFLFEAVVLLELGPLLAPFVLSFIDGYHVFPLNLPQFHISDACLGMICYVIYLLSGYPTLLGAAFSCLLLYLQSLATELCHIESRRFAHISAFYPETVLRLIWTLGKVTPGNVQPSCMLDIFLEPADRNDGLGRAKLVKAVLSWILDDPRRFRC
jgi:hypothetical protein